MLRRPNQKRRGLFNPTLLRSASAVGSGSRQPRELMVVPPKIERALLADAQANPDPDEFKSLAIMASLVVLAEAAVTGRAEEPEAQEG